MAIKINYKHDIIHRVLSQSIPVTSGCIIYKPEKLKHKYGLISITINGKRKPIPAHRALYMATNELWELPRSVMIRHKCDNPRCINIDHLIPGTALDNMHDCIDRRRRAKKYKKHTRIRIHSKEKVDAIRTATGRIQTIADTYGVSNSYVSKIKNGKLKGPF